MNEDTIRTITMQGHPPIRTRQEPEELWLGYDYLDFGGRYLRAMRTRDGRLILWFRRTPANNNEKPVTRYIATLPPVATAAGTLEQAQEAHHNLAALLDDYLDYLGDPGPVQSWLADLGYSIIADID